MATTLVRSNDPLLQPYQLKHLTLKNRIISTAHEPNYHDGNGMPGERYRLYHVEKAKGGIAMTMTAGSASVARDSPPAFGNLLAYRDEIVPHLRRLADDCHEHGCAVMIQLTHLGRRTGWNKADWLPVLAPSPVREPAHRAFPKTIEDWDIERIIADYAGAAQRMQAAGLDGIEFEAYGHLLDQFWSPATNKRHDDYGGSIDNRLRFTYRVLDAVREAVGPDFIVGLRLVVDEDWRQGLTREEGLEIARRLIGTGQIDFLNVIRGHIDSDPALTKVIPVHGMRAAPHLDFAGEVKAATKFPVFHAARISDVATARHAVASGKLDLVGMTRAHIADPHIVRKIEQGREHEIRPCVGATYCLDRIYEAGEALCIHNAATGREATMPHVIPPAEKRGLKAVVVGAGPAGLEAARVLAERGHAVTLFEAADKPGGQIRLIAQLARRKEFIGIVDWRMARLEALGIAMRFNHLADTVDVLAQDPDLVIVATGGLPQHPPIEQGGDLAVSTWDILSGDVKPAEEVLLYDDNGAHPGLTAAQFLVEQGASLELVTPERMFFPDVGGMNLVPYLAALQRHGARLTIGTTVRAIRREGNKLAVALASDYAEQDIGERLVDQVVVEHGTLPLDELYFTLKDRSVNRGAVDYDALISGHPQAIRSNPQGSFQLFRIGDAVASRNIHAAIYDALRLCKDL
ncbi:NADH:flavin oxidoreductase [Rhodoligotrophos defluvii]|uniref:NADH:flavin oxidoreductase n=1 Tax=Rhodoligotrophos defluvii TaxID=2561934 RepID=UPI0010C93B96|nr:NADH:flavin oxidoreductase [Rhodoligotrophos defluvii]